MRGSSIPQSASSVSTLASGANPATCGWPRGYGSRAAGSRDRNYAGGKSDGEAVAIGAGIEHVPACTKGGLDLRRRRQELLEAHRHSRAVGDDRVRARSALSAAAWPGGTTWSCARLM